MSFDTNDLNNQAQVTVRGTIVGLGIGTLVLLSNFQFGLQTGWVSMMSLPAALMAYSIFKVFKSSLELPFTPQENVYVQSVAVAVATGPLAYGFIGIIPAIEKLLTPEEAGFVDKIFALKDAVFDPFKPWWKLIVWSAGLAFFGVFFAIPLREEFILRQKLKFPSGSATATLISVFHGSPLKVDVTQKNDNHKRLSQDADLEDLSNMYSPNSCQNEYSIAGIEIEETYSKDIVMLLFTATISSVYTLISYFLPQIKTIPIFGTFLSSNYLLNFTPSPAYVGQGIIMGFQTTCGMMVGMIIGWCVLSPLAKYMKWAPGPTDDWIDGSEGWIMWISLSIMISDSLVTLGLMTFNSIKNMLQSKTTKHVESESNRLLSRSSEITLQEDTSDNTEHSYSSSDNEPDMSASGITACSRKQEEESISYWIPSIGLLICCPMLIVSMKIIFGHIVPSWLLLLTIPVSLGLSLIGVKSLGETDLNPVSGIGKLSQLLTALVIPPTRPGAVLINLVVGAISEATAQQAGDLMQDLKTGYLVNASPYAQLIAQIIGSIWGIIIATPMYKWYNHLYEIPGPLYKIPTAVIWIDCARLVNGHHLPERVGTFVIFFGILFFILALIKGINNESSKYYRYTKFIPSGVAVGIGIYNTPSFTLARFLGGLISWYWLSRARATNQMRSSAFENSKVTLIIFSSGLVLGEGLFSVVNMMMASFGVPHL
ncbi:hypothetical protein CANINC_000809 [Pichia inconspicua]|uniref:OPT superfamily oligopeptide transporter n=1 Tax=Pichia inconspicua TaxID=52247 RepID=A0A4T0X5T1_9ASCO|nr:hypothetical protein CANINC_000809 [[Candida] inconspicua]